MSNSYFHGAEANSYAFYRIPKILFTSTQYQSVSIEAKLLYSLMLDRMELSARNGWLDAEGRVYIFYTEEAAASAIGCGAKKIRRLFGELETVRLIVRKRQGQGKPCMIFLQKFAAADPDQSEAPVKTGSSGQVKKGKNDRSAPVKTASQDRAKGPSNQNNLNQTKLSEIQSVRSSEHTRPDIDRTGEREKCREEFSERMGIDLLKKRRPDDTEQLEEILALVVDTFCSQRSEIKLSGDSKPIEVVRSRLGLLEEGHIEFVLDNLKQISWPVRNMKQYLLASLYNATMCISNAYDARIRYDLSH